jgi:CRP-like cAMP-binding protein
MFGSKPSRTKDESHLELYNRDIAKVFFDSFSKRVGSVEEGLRNMSSELEKLKMSVDRNQISDLVLLERIQKAEDAIRETLGALKVAIQKAIETERGQSQLEVTERGRSPKSRDTELGTRGELGIATHVLSPTGEVGSLPSITTPTELQVLTLLASEGPMSAPEIGKAVGRSREHTARLMKKLYEEGYIRRDQTRIPFRYSVVDRLKQSVKKSEVKDEEKEPISVPQT